MELPGVSSTPGTESQSQDYYEHLTSPAHRESFGQFIIFSSRKDNKHYKQVLQDLMNLKEKCLKAKLAYSYGTHELDQVIDDIQEEIDESIKTVSSHEKTRSWREGSSAISTLTESLSKSLHKYTKLYVKVSEELKTRHQNEQINDDVLTQDLEELERHTEKHDPIYISHQ